MITPTKLIKIARKWQKLPATRRKGMSFPRSFGYGDAVVCSSRPSMAEKGHFVVYSADGKRFVLPLAYLKNKTIGQLFRLAEEEFGMHSNGPLTLPCVANYLESVISLVRSHVQEMVVELVIRWVIEISDKPGEEEPEPAFEFIGNFHGDKPVGRELLLRLANCICDNYAKDSLINARQPETRAIMNWLREIQFAASASLHGGALVANYPWGGTEDNK
uniref:Peptidase M14 domain-containing protein n=1 Tax=Populus alba TaxID=43335 RepID=A0A4U5R4N6_POPAL|nr:hypothetical protein D5086_0000004090 [Populus alba]